MTHATLFIDYASMNCSATEIYTDGTLNAVRRDLDPTLFTKRLVRRNTARGTAIAHIDSIHVYAGLPSQRVEPVTHGRWQAAFDRWDRDDSRTKVHRALLDYRAGTTHRPRNRRSTVDMSAGILEASLTGETDTVLIATRATPLASTLDVLARVFSGHVQLISWETPRLRIDGSTSRCSVSSISLDEDDWIASSIEDPDGIHGPKRTKPHQARRPVGIDMATVWDPPVPNRQRHASTQQHSPVATETLLGNETIEATDCFRAQMAAVEAGAGWKA